MTNTYLGQKMEDLWKTLTDKYCSGRFVYRESDGPFARLAKSHFRGKDGHGVYIVKKKGNQRVLYIGKAGTVKQDGSCKNQTLCKRITNIRGNDMPANEWFADMFLKYGELLVEYVVLPEPLISNCPAYYEACLLQTYVAQHRCLPEMNKSF